jgi:hypothetical protein
LAVFTDKAKATIGDEAACRHEAVNSVEDVNDILLLSEAKCQFRLVGVCVTDQYAEPAAIDAYQTMLDDFTSEKKPLRVIYLENVPRRPRDVSDLRITCGADVVAVFVHSSKAAGLSNIMCSRADADIEAFKKMAYCIVNHSYAADGRYHTLAHELGHLFGCCHERQHHRNTVICDYAYAYPEVSLKLPIKTLMCRFGPRIPRFSNPAVSYDQNVTGRVPGFPDSSDNAKVISESAPFVEAFLPRRAP